MHAPRTTRPLALLFLLAAPAPALAQVWTVPERYEVGEVAVWAFEQGGHRIGHCRSSYVGELELAGAPAHRFESQVRLELAVPGGTLLQEYSAGLWTDAAGHALLLEFHARLGETYGGARITFTGREARAEVRQGVTNETREVGLAGETFVLANNFLSHLELPLVLDPPVPGAASSYSMFSANVLAAFPISVEFDEDAAETDGGAVLRDSLGEVLHLNAEGKLERVEVPAANLVMRRVDELPDIFRIEPPSPAPRPDLDREEVRIEDGDVVIAGTITRPKGVEGRLPGIFFISGSGAQDREGYAAGIDIGTGTILDRLTLEGFCVLRVDDRSAGRSSALPADASFEDLVADARRALRFLRARPDVDPEHVFLIGHSEGGQTAPILAAQETGLAGIVLMAAPGRSVLELLREQLLRGKRLTAASDEESEAFAAELDRFLVAVAAGDPIARDSLSEDLRPFASSSAWLRSHAAQDPVRNLERVACPVLILQGARDIQVSHERDAPPLLEALERVGHPDHELVIFPELDHLFKRSESEQPTGLEYFEDRPVDEGFLVKLASWLQERS